LKVYLSKQAESKLLDLTAYLFIISTKKPLPEKEVA
jgi:hypothetical protein